jgi:hypothetical protein
MINIGSDQKQDYQFELVIQVRDAQGNPTGKTKSFLTNKAEELESYYNRNSGRLKKKKKKIEAATTDKQITEGLKEVENHIQKIRKQKQLED